MNIFLMTGKLVSVQDMNGKNGPFRSLVFEVDRFGQPKKIKATAFSAVCDSMNKYGGVQIGAEYEFQGYIDSFEREGAIFNNLVLSFVQRKNAGAPQQNGGYAPQGAYRQPMRAQHPPVQGMPYPTQGQSMAVPQMPAQGMSAQSHMAQTPVQNPVQTSYQTAQAPQFVAPSNTDFATQTPPPQASPQAPMAENTGISYPQFKMPQMPPADQPPQTGGFKPAGFKTGGMNPMPNPEGN